jgi:hypothetical protein
MVANKRDYNRDFDYQLTHYLPKELLSEVKKTLTDDKRYENLHWVEKKRGREEVYAIFTKGEFVNDTPKDICRRGMA